MADRVRVESRFDKRIVHRRTMQLRPVQIRRSQRHEIGLMRAGPLFVVMALVFSLVASVAASPVAADEPSTWTGDVPDGMWYDPSVGHLRSDALERDASIVAEGSGLDYDRVLAYLRAGERLDSILDVVRSRFPDSFVGLYWDDNLQAGAQFKGRVPSEALDLLAGSGVDFKPEIVRYSARELDDLHDALRRSLEAMGISDFVVATDARNQRLVATIGTGSGLAQNDHQPASREAVIGLLPQQLVEAGVEIDVVDGPAGTPWTTYGGAEVGQNGAFACTSGFTVVTGSTDGVATAGHCGTSLNQYFDPFTGALHGMTYKNGLVGTWGDFEWFTTTGTEVDDFYHTPGGARRDVSGVKNSFAVGDTLFWFGWGTATEFNSTVRYTRVAYGGRDHLVCMNGGQGGPGDSGGPVYTGNSAAGYIMGGLIIDGAQRMCFSQARYIDDAMGVSIKQ